MSELTADEMYDRIVRSLKANSAELAREQRAERNARVRYIAIVCGIFVAGAAAGALLMTVL